MPLARADPRGPAGHLVGQRDLDRPARELRRTARGGEADPPAPGDPAIAPAGARPGPAPRRRKLAREGRRVFERAIEAAREVADRNFRTRRHEHALAVDRFANPDPEGEQRLPELRGCHERHDRFALTVDRLQEPPLPRLQRETPAGAGAIGRAEVSRDPRGE